MKVFISWSGDQSKAIAEAFRDWLPNVIQQIEPFMSQWDIAAGERWGERLTKELGNTNFGIVCLTPESLNAPWLLFEAGALSKSLSSRVCTYLLGLKFADVRAPLSQFNHRLADENGTRDVLKSINAALDGASLPEARLEKAFSRWWPEFAAKLAEIEKIHTVAAPVRSEREMIEEILEWARGAAVPWWFGREHWNILQDPAEPSSYLIRIPIAGTYTTVGRSDITFTSDPRLAAIAASPASGPRPSQPSSPGPEQG